MQFFNVECFQKHETKAMMSHAPNHKDVVQISGKISKVINMLLIRYFMRKGWTVLYVEVVILLSPEEKKG